MENGNKCYAFCGRRKVSALKIVQLQNNPKILSGNFIIDIHELRIIHLFLTGLAILIFIALVICLKNKRLQKSHVCFTIRQFIRVSHSSIVVSNICNSVFSCLPNTTNSFGYFVFEFPLNCFHRFSLFLVRFEYNWLLLFQLVTTKIKPTHQIKWERKERI